VRLLFVVLAACTDTTRIPLGSPDADTAGEPSAAPGAPWTRDERETPASISFTELMYRPSDGGADWIELYNPMSFDMDLSGWSLAGGAEHDFADGTLLGARDYVVIPVTAGLDDDGDRLELYNNAGRLIDTVAYADDAPWPVGPDGSGHSLAKRGPELWSDHAENWTVSAEPGGTPGLANGLDTPTTTVELLPLTSTWRYDDGGGPSPAGWADPGFDDAAWPEGEAVFYAGGPAGDASGVVQVTADNYYAVYLGDADGTDLRLVAEDPDGNWTTVEAFDLDVAPTDHLYVAAWEADWDDGGPQMVIAEVEVEGVVVGTAADTFEVLLGPVDGYPGVPPGDATPPETEVAALAGAGGWQAPAVEADRTSDPWGWATSASFRDGIRYVWIDSFSETSVTNVDNTYALFRSVAPLRGGGGATDLGTAPTTTRFRTSFTLDADPATTRLFVTCELDDGAVFYLNGVEAHRANMPAGAVSADTPAAREADGEITAELDTTALGRGVNVLAVEVHQAGDDDLRFGCSLRARVANVVKEPAARLNEVTSTWVEVAATADGPLLLAWPGGEAPLDGEAGALGVVEDLDLPVDKPVFLYSADGATLLDALRVGERPRARDTTGEWRFPVEATPGENNRVALETSVVVNEILYHPAAGEAEWIELYNRGDDPVDLSGWQLVDAVGYAFPSGTRLDPGGYLVVRDFAGRLDNSSDHVVLLDAAGNVADEVRYFDDGAWPSAADGGGSSLELRDPRADNALPGAWAASDESARGTWATYTWEGIPEPSAVGPDGAWNELVLGLLDAGELLLDDVSVVRDPDGAAVELVRGGDFEADADRWRLLGNHRHGERIPDPDDPGNTVLRLVATGPTGHMHNHVETTLREALTTSTHRVSFRARWVSGSPQLNTRLYFNRLATTTIVDTPAAAGTPGETNSTAEALGPTLLGLAQDIAVPGPYEPVGIAVTATDPDGVRAVTLWSSVDGDAFAGTPMASSGDTWTTALPGQPAGAIVQFYVEAEDGEGHTSWLPARGPDSRALVTFDGGEAEDNGLHNLRVLVTAADSDWLHADVNLMSDDLLGATVIYDETEVVYDVGVRLKGSERGRPEDLRIGYALRFPGEQPFRGSHRGVLVDRSEGVGYGQREVLANLAMTGAGSVSGEYNDLAHAITPLPQHTGPVELQLDRASGLVLAAQFEGGDETAAWEYELIYYPLTTDDGTAEGLKLPQPDSVVGAAITDLGDDKEDWRWTFLLSSDPRDDDYDAIMRVGRAFAAGDFPARAEEVIDVDQWLRAFAFATLSGAVDNYGADGSQHNARFYVRPDDGRVLYFPHDIDFIGSSRMGLVGNGDLARLLTVPAWERRYYDHLQDIVGRAWNADYLGHWCDQIGALLPAQDFAGHCQFVDERAAWVLEGSPDAVLTRFPRVTFAVTSGDLETTEPTVVIEGRGWIDVRTITAVGAAWSPEWLDDKRWRVSVPVEVGETVLDLVALDQHGAAVGTASVRVTRTE
jgi:hypothetical protein